MFARCRRGRASVDKYAGRVHGLLSCFDHMPFRGHTSLPPPDCHTTYLTIEALREYLNAQAWEVQDIKAGLEQADSGEFARETEVADFFAKYDC